MIANEVRESLDDLIKNKIVVGRNIDKEDIKELDKIKGGSRN